MSADVQKFDDAVASLTAPGQGFELDTVEIDGIEYRNYAAMPANLGEYYQVMLQHAPKDFAVYLEERYTFEQAYQHSSEFAAALVGRRTV